MPIKDISICKLPYQDHPFVHGVRDGIDVWLLSDGTWTEEETHPDAGIPLEHTVIMLDEVRPCPICEGIGYHHDIKQNGPDETRWFACGHCWGHGYQDSKGNACGDLKTRPIEVKLRSKR